MTLVEDLIQDALDDAKSLSTILRRCLVLADQLNNQDLKEWANQELDGYAGKEHLPDYRILRTVAKGFFVGPMGMSIQNQPLPSALMEERHREFAEKAYLPQPIASYVVGDKDGCGVIEWPPNLTAKYQSKFFEGYALNRAWQEIPNSVMLGLLDTIRNRILRFALEIKKQLGEVRDNPASLAPEKVEQTVTAIIYGGQNIIGSQARDIQQIGSIHIQQGDKAALRARLHVIGLSEDAIDELEAALAKDIGTPGVGPNTRSWLSRLSDAGLKFTGSVASGLITEAVQVFGTYLVISLPKRQFTPPPKTATHSR